MSIRVSGLLACLSFAGAAWGEIRLEVKFSLDGGATWSRQVEGLVGSTIQGAIFMSSDIPNFWGLGGGTMRLTGTNFANDSLTFGAQTDTGRVAPFNFGAATNAIYRDSASTWRIDAASDATNTNELAGLTFFQRDPSSGGAIFIQANPAMVFRFDVHAAAGGPFRELRFELDQLSRGVATYYSSSSSTRPTQTSDVVLQYGSVILSPAPGSVAVLAAGACMTSRRRRRAEG